MDDSTGPENRPEDQDPFLALLAGNPAPSVPTEAHDPRKENSAKARILANLGLRRGMPSDLGLSDTELAETLDQWTLQPVRSLPRPERTDDEATEVTLEIDGAVVTEILDRNEPLHLIITTVDIDDEETRIEARAALPDEPRIHDEVLLATITCGPEGHLVSFPLRVRNEGTEDFPLWSLIGGATVPPRGPVRAARLTIERYGDPDHPNSTDN